MSYSNAAFAQANSILAERRIKAQNIRERRHADIVITIPQIPDYEAQLANSGLAVIKALGMGENAERYISELSKVNAEIQAKISDLLEKNDYPRDYLDTPYHCRKCEDTGFVNGFFCDCRKELLRELTKGSLPTDASFDNFNLEYIPESDKDYPNISLRERMKSILDYCRCYAVDFGLNSKSLFLHGATGLGKTHLSLAIANVVSDKGYNIIYDSAQNIFSSLEREKFGGGTGKREKEIFDCDLLIIDDLGSEFSTQFTVAALFNIINTRLVNAKPVIISTNFNEKELEAKYTQRVTSRIIGNYVSILFIGKDIRQIKAKE